MQIELKLTIDQVNGIMTALGELPVKSGAGQLMNEIRQQVIPQLPEQTEEATDSDEESTVIGS
jgi:hypothetical protein